MFPIVKNGSLMDSMVRTYKDTCGAWVERADDMAHKKVIGEFFKETEKKKWKGIIDKTNYEADYS